MVKKSRRTYDCHRCENGAVSTNRIAGDDNPNEIMKILKVLKKTDK